jgi:hypothetical protein
MINYHDHSVHKGYHIYRRIEDARRDYVGVQGVETWFEGDTVDAVREAIDEALEEVK